MDHADLDFVARHPGGFDREFWLSNLQKLAAAYSSEHGLDYSTMIITVHLRNGEVHAVTQASRL